MLQEIIMAGFGGQGVMLMGQLLTYSGMLENKQVSWIPSYGPEMRGGTANCSVIVSDEPIGAPIVTEANAVVAMNRPSLDKFESSIRTGGLLIVNSSLVDKKVERTDIKVIEIPINDIAATLGNPRVANMVALGAFVAATGIVDPDSVLQSFKKMFKDKEHLVNINKQALNKGIEYVKNL
jgi:2-oxoglutarate ferredoxin oxidoreductase subunit gamma